MGLTPIRKIDNKWEPVPEGDYEPKEGDVLFQVGGPNYEVTKADPVRKMANIELIVPDRFRPEDLEWLRKAKGS